jgi:hypothetical protein
MKSFLKSLPVLSFALCVTVWTTAQSQILTPQLDQAEIQHLMSKTTKVVLERAQAGIEQKVHVSFEWDDIREKEEKQRRAKGLHINDDEIEAEVRANIRALRESIFPNGRLGAITVVWAPDSVPTEWVTLPSYADLLQLLGHKKVKRVQEDRVVSPA